MLGAAAVGAPASRPTRLALTDGLAAGASAARGAGTRACSTVGLRPISPTSTGGPGMATEAAVSGATTGWGVSDGPADDGPGAAGGSARGDLVPCPSRSTRSRSACSRALKNLLTISPSPAHQVSQPSCQFGERSHDVVERSRPECQRGNEGAADPGREGAADPHPAWEAEAAEASEEPASAPWVLARGWPLPFLQVPDRLLDHVLVDVAALVSAADQETVVADRVDDPRDAARKLPDPIQGAGGEDPAVATPGDGQPRPNGPANPPGAK